MRLMLLWGMASRLPTTMLKPDRPATSRLQCGASPSSGPTNTRMTTAKPAAFGATDGKPVTGVGAPSYTSGPHMWKGAAVILKASPPSTNTMPTTSPGVTAPPGASAMRMPTRLVVPVQPNSRLAPYRNTDDDTAPSSRNFSPASPERG